MSILKPIEGFVHVEAAGGVVLVLAAAVALVWANSPWGDAYEHLWETHVSIGLGSWAVDKSLHFWINELLMTVFFLVVGLEIKREIFEGALSNVKAAILPIGAAVGGMVVPALIYLALNATGPGSRGWGIAMATDIAFAVGVLTLLGNRIHPALRVLLLALAIIDDIGAILVIALFYSSGFQIAGLAWAASGYLVLVVLLKTGVRSGLIFIPPFLVIWAGFLMMGIHPTIAGVIVGLTAPARSWFGKEGFVEVAQEALDEFRERTSRMHRIDDLFGPLNRLGTARREALSPALRLQVGLHPWVAFAIIPLFALANAGVRVSDVSFGDVGSVTVFWGIVIGLALGKPLGVLLASWVAIRSGGHRLPEGITWPGIAVVGGVAGIGFTMAIFIAELAFRGQEFLGLAKLAVLIGSGVAATAGLVMGRFALSGRVDSGETLSEMESAEYWVGTDSSPN